MQALQSHHHTAGKGIDRLGRNRHHRRLRRRRCVRQAAAARRHANAPRDRHCAVAGRGLPRGARDQLHCHVLPAHAAQTGLRAAMLAERGFSSSTVALEGRYGYLSVFCEEPDIEALAGGLGERFELCSNTYKPYPCGIVIHPIIDACLKLRQDHAIPADRIAHVAIKASAGAMALCDRRTPRDEMEAHVSLYHWAAVAILRGTARMVDADTEIAVRDPAVVAFRGRVDAAADQSLASDAAAVTLTMTD